MTNDNFTGNLAENLASNLTGHMNGNIETMSPLTPGGLRLQDLHEDMFVRSTRCTSLFGYFPRMMQLVTR